MPKIGRPRAEVVVTDDERAALVRLTAIESMYARLCEVAHPNYMGMIEAYHCKDAEQVMVDATAPARCCSSRTSLSHPITGRTTAARPASSRPSIRNS